MLCKAKITRWLFQTILISANTSVKQMDPQGPELCQLPVLGPRGNAIFDRLTYKVKVLLLLVLPWKNV